LLCGLLRCVSCSKLTMIQPPPRPDGCPKTETETAFVFSCAGPVAAHGAARKVILVVSPDVTEHNLKGSPRPVAAADCRPVHHRAPPSRRRPHGERDDPHHERGGEPAARVRHLDAVDPGGGARGRAEPPSLTHARREQLQRRPLRPAGAAGAATIFREPRRPVVIREQTPATARSADQGAA
jgi:hypothetical protein